MRFSTALLAAALAAVSVSANFNASTVYTTEVVTAYTTFCPAATSIVHGTQTYVVTEVRTIHVSLRRSVRQSAFLTLRL